MGLSGRPVRPAGGIVFESPRVLGMFVQKLAIKGPFDPKSQSIARVSAKLQKWRG